MSGGSIYRAPVNRRVAIVLVASAVVLVVALPNHFHPRSGSASGGSIADWYALNGPQGNCARRYDQHTIQTHYDYDLVICHRAGRPYTCWEPRSAFKRFRNCAAQDFTRNAATRAAQTARDPSERFLRGAVAGGSFSTLPLKG